MKRLYRSRNEKKIAGVCGGIAAYFSIDPTLVRAAAIIVTLPGLIHGLIAYIILWAIMPEELGK